MGLPRSPGARFEMAALALVVLYVNTFEVWQVLVDRFGRLGASLVPGALTIAIAATVVALSFRHARQRRPVDWPAIVAAGALAAAALLLTDPDFPAKRIHVPQYMVLAIVVSHALKFHLTGGPLLAASALATAVLGSHDELLQGLYPARTFGLSDLAVNAVSGLAGALLAHAFRPAPNFAGGAPGWRAFGRQLDAAQWLALLIVSAGWLMLLVSVPALRGPAFPFWPLVPLAAGGVAWALASDPRAPATGASHAGARVAILMLATAVYPLSTHAFPLALH